MSDTSDIFSFVCFQNGYICVDQFKKMTFFESNSARELESIECESDDTHTRECSWSTDTPDFFYVILIDHFDNFSGKEREVISFWYDDLVESHTFLQNIDMYIYGYRIYEEYFGHVLFWLNL